MDLDYTEDLHQVESSFYVYVYSVLFFILFVLIFWLLWLLPSILNSAAKFYIIKIRN